MSDVFADVPEGMPLPYQPLALCDAVAEEDHLSVQDRIDAIGLSREERDLVNGLLNPGVLGTLLRRGADATMRCFSVPGWASASCSTRLRFWAADRRPVTQFLDEGSAGSVRRPRARGSRLTRDRSAGVAPLRVRL